MDPEIINWAHKFKSLIDGKHQFARAIDASTRHLIQHVIGRSPQPPTPASVEYKPSKEALKVDLQAFTDAVFRVLSRPPPPPIDEAVARTFKSSTATIEKTLAAHTKALEIIMGQSTEQMAHTTRVVEPLNRVAVVVENIDKNVASL